MVGEFSSLALYFPFPFSLLATCELSYLFSNRNFQVVFAYMIVRDHPKMLFKSKQTGFGQQEGGYRSMLCTARMSS